MDRVIAAVLFFVLAGLHGFLASMIFADEDLDRITAMLGACCVAVSFVSIVMAIYMLVG